MNISDVSPEQIKTFSVGEKTEIVYGGVIDYEGSSDVILLLGGNPTQCVPRAEAAAKLMNEKKARFIIPSGGVKWDCESGKKSEADIMTDVLVNSGVDPEVIFAENEATTTVENMLFSVIVILRKLADKNIRTITVVTSAFHMKRSLALAAKLIPDRFEVRGFSAHPVNDYADKWFTDETMVKRVDSEILYLSEAAREKIALDIDIHGLN